MYPINACQETIPSFVATVEFCTETCVDGVGSDSCKCDLGFRETDIDGEEVCGIIDCDVFDVVSSLHEATSLTHTTMRRAQS